MSETGIYSKDEKERIMNQVRSALGEVKVPEPVLERAIHDPLYLHHILLVKDSPSLLEKLIREVMDAAPSTVSTNIRQPSIKEIVNATQSILNAVAFPSLRTSDTELKLRIDACYSCSNRVTAPNQGFYKFSKIAMGNEICSLCGCHIETKARLVKERCPAPDGVNPELNRWKQPIKT